jgi:hypothetical protein
MAGTPDQIAADWAAGLASKTDKMARGAAAVTVAPGQAAARQKNVYVANVQASADKWAANTQAVSLPEWQQSFVNKGIPRIASGAQAAQPKFAQAMASLLPHIASTKSSLPPRGTLEQNIDRAARFARGMASYRKGR